MYLSHTPTRGTRRFDLSDSLPTEAYNQNWQLVCELADVDPVYLVNKDTLVLYRWDYIPTLGEVFDVCQELLHVPFKFEDSGSEVIFHE